MTQQPSSVPETGAKVKKHILILDDEEGTRNILERMLYRAGFNVSVAATGKQVLQRFQANHRYDLIICDIRTPLMSGIEVMKELRGMKVDVPAIFISGAPSRGHIETLRSMGIETLLVKPIKTSILIEKIREMIDPESLKTPDVKAEAAEEPK